MSIDKLSGMLETPSGMNPLQYSFSTSRAANCHHFVRYDETIAISLPGDIGPGKCTQLKITLDYNGVFTGDLTGFYQSSYETDDGTTHRVAANGHGANLCKKGGYQKSGVREIVIYSKIMSSLVSMNRLGKQNSSSLSWLTSRLWLYPICPSRRLKACLCRRNWSLFRRAF